MSYIKKTILLTNKNDDMAVLNILKDNYNTFGSIKHANFNSQNLILGISVDNKQVLKQNLSLLNGTYNFKFDNSFDINSNIGCVIVDKKDDSFKPMVWGNNDDIVDYKRKILDSLNMENQRNNTYNKQKEVKKDSIISKIDLRNEIDQIDKIIESETTKLNSLSDKDSGDSLIHKNNCEDDLSQAQSDQIKCDSCDKSKEYISINNKSIKSDNENQNSVNSKNNQNSNEKLLNSESIEAEKINSKLFDDSDVDEKISESINDDGDFFDMISEQIDELFNNNPRDEALENLIPNSKWVKVVFDETLKEYVVGLIYDEGILKYVCYGMKGEFNNNPLKDMQEYSQWLPLNSNEPEGDGYWIMFQDAQTGDSIKY